MGLFAQLMRRKRVSEDSLGDTNLARVLGLVDLSCLAIGSTLGLGIYVLAGDVAKNEAGPAVVISFLVAAVASLFAALCYAEFAARVPRAGSAYVYSYVCVGEFIAFIIGWNLILEYVIGTASVARGYSTYVDSIFDNKMAAAFTRCCGMNVDFLSPYPDFFAFGIVFLLAVLLSVGVKESTQFNNVFTFCNLVVVTYVIVCGLFKVDGANWKVDPQKVNADNPGNNYKLGTGGFFPFGFGGMMAGAARCFYGFVGFDAVATTGEEAKNPQRNIPLSIVLGLTVIFFSYFGVSAVLTLMYPYYLQEENAPIPAVFRHLGWESARWIVTIGALFGLSSSLLGALFPLPRILYAMAKDGVIFRCMAAIHPRFQTPFWSTLLAGVFAAVMASIFALEQLVDMMSIGTLLAYTLVGICVLVLRYRDESIGMVVHGSDADHHPNSASKDQLLPPKEPANIMALLFNSNRQKDPSHLTAMVVNYATLTYAIITVGFCATIVYGADAIMDVDVWAVILTAVLGAAMLVCVAIVFLQPQSKAHLFFKVPLVPFLPMLSVFVNVYLMMKLNSATWIRFGAWMAIGFVVYFGYGLWFSSEREQKDGPQRPADGNTINRIHAGIQLPTITIQPATPVNGSATATPHTSRPDEPGSPDSQTQTPRFAVEVETCPEPLPREDDLIHGETNSGFVATEDDVSMLSRLTSKGVARSPKLGVTSASARVEDQEATLLYLSHLVKHQHGLHAVIRSTLRPTWSESGRGRQLALWQQQRHQTSPTARYTAPLAAAQQPTAEMLEWAACCDPIHRRVCRCLGVPADGRALPIRVSAEVHSDASSDIDLDPPDPLEAKLASDDPLVSALVTDDSESTEKLTLNLTENGWSKPESIAPEGILAPPTSDNASVFPEIEALHAAICECVQRDWIDLGTGALLADRQRERYAGIEVVSPPPVVSSQAATLAAGASAVELQTLAELLTRQHTAIVASLATTGPPRTPPNTPTNQRHGQSQLSPLRLTASLPPPDSGSEPARPRRPLSRTVSGEAGFSTIPPQSPDSPYAKRVGSKFVIIPVDDGTDSEREEDGMDAADSEVRRAMRSVQHQVRAVLSKADDDDADDEAATPTSSEATSNDKDGGITPIGEEGDTLSGHGTTLLRRDSDSTGGDIDATPPGGDSDRSCVGEDGDVTPTQEMFPLPPPAGLLEHLSEQHPASIGDESTSPTEGSQQAPEEHNSPVETTPPPEVRRAMGSVLSELRHSLKRGPPPPPTPPGFTPQPKRVAHSRRNTNPKLAAAPPEPSMKDQLDQIIAQAVAKAARRVTDHWSSSGDDSSEPPAPESSVGSAAASSPVSDSLSAAAQQPSPAPPPTDSKQSQPVPTFDINELKARFEKK